MIKYEVIRYTNMLGKFGGREKRVFVTRFKLIAVLSMFFFLYREYEEQFIKVFYRKVEE